MSSKESFGLFFKINGYPLWHCDKYSSLETAQNSALRTNDTKEYKNNIRHKDNYAGYAPRTWQLIKQDINGNQTVLINGVIDYDLLPDGSILYTNGKHVLIKNLDGKVQKIADTTMCTQVSCFK